MAETIVPVLVGDQEVLVGIRLAVRGVTDAPATPAEYLAEFIDGLDPLQLMHAALSRPDLGSGPDAAVRAVLAEVSDRLRDTP